MKQKEHEGCLVLIGVVGIHAVLLAIAYWLDCPFLKYACYMFPGLSGSYRQYLLQPRRKTGKEPLLSQDVDIAGHRLSGTGGIAGVVAGRAVVVTITKLSHYNPIH